MTDPCFKKDNNIQTFCGKIYKRNIIGKYWDRFCAYILNFRSISD